MIGVHMRDDFRLGGSQRGRVAGKAQVLALDPGDAAEPCHEMAALDIDAIEMKIGEAGVDGARRVPRREAGSGTCVVNALGAPEQRQPRPGERVGISGSRLEQQRHGRLGQQVACVRCEVGQQQQRAGVNVAGHRDKRDVWPPAEAGGQRRVIATADQMPGFHRARQQIVIHDGYRRSNSSFCNDILQLRAREADCGGKCVCDR
jgi:hypothetical protein